MGFTRPTPIQVRAIPMALRGRDVLASAMTGSGKTAAFLLPILQRLREKPRGTTRALVVTPTRELAAQIVEHLEGLAKGTGIRGAAVYGGVGMGPQVQAFRQGVDILVATPGRLLDHFQHDYAGLAGIEVLVLDEADRMLDMGFLPDIRRVIRHLPNVPAAPGDYIHRVGRTARAEATGEAYTFVSPQEEGEVRAIERALGRRIERRTLKGFDYGARAKERFEVPIGERIAGIRARKAEERARSRTRAQRKEQARA